MALLTMTFALPPFVRPAHAALTAVGPIDPADGMPLWYEDPNGLRLKQCLDIANCMVVLPNPALPIQFPTNYPTETFYWRAVSIQNVGAGGIGKATLTLATEAAFLGPVALGQQTLFSRIRVFISGGLVPGATYTVTEPYGVDTVTADALGIVHFTENAGCTVPPCPGNVPIPGRIGRGRAAPARLHRRLCGPACGHRQPPRHQLLPHRWA
jgi:hypothetical protein